jgi:LmbE family N-acetylglucosaminyl deacetylase
VCASHADDEVLGMGATIAKLSAAGHTVYCWFYFSGTNCNGVRQEQPKEVAELLGTVYPPFVMPLTVDNEADTVPLLSIAQSIEDIIEKTKPAIVYTHLAQDLNIDHRRVAEATLVATRPRAKSSVRSVLSYEIPSVSDWSFGQLGGIAAPNVYEHLTIAQVNAKYSAICRYGMLGLFPPDDRLRSSRIYAELRGMQSGALYAEAFELVWERNTE